MRRETSRPVTREARSLTSGPFSGIRRSMAVGSVLAGIASFLFLIGGFVLTVLPAVGAALSFVAPVLALVGLVLGGLAMSRARQEGAPSGTALAGVIVSAMAFIPALLVALTCGLCNACVTAGMMNPGGSSGGPTFQYGVRTQRTPLPSAPPTRPDAGVPDAGRVRPFDAGTLPPGAPPPAFPPPPMPSKQPDGSTRRPQ